MKKQILILILFIATHNAFSQSEQPVAPKEEIYMIVEEMPEFPGGLDAQKKFIADHIVYPAKALQRGTEGRVHISFIIDKNGKVSDPEIVRGLGDGCDEEAIRLVNSMPTWKAGKQNGKAVLVKYTIPVTFSLSKK